jgi:hypothetical protein
MDKGGIDTYYSKSYDNRKVFGNRFLMLKHHAITIHLNPVATTHLR